MAHRNISTLARTEAVENFTSSEQLDQRLIVVRGKSWFLLVIGIAAIASAVAWGILGRVPTVIDGEGIVAPRDTWPVEIDSSYAYGSVVEMVIPEGAEVEVGDRIIRLRNPEQEKALENLQSRLKTLKDEDDRLNTAEDRIIELQKRSLDARIANATQILDQTHKLVTMLEEEVDSLEGLVKDQLIPRSELVQTRSALFTSMQQLTQQESVMAEARAGHDTLINSTEINQVRAEVAYQISLAELAQSVGCLLGHAGVEWQDALDIERLEHVVPDPAVDVTTGD